MLDLYPDDDDRSWIERLAAAFLDDSEPAPFTEVEETKRPPYEDPNGNGDFSRSAGVAWTGRSFAHETYNTTLGDGNTETGIVPITLYGASKIMVGLDTGGGAGSVFVRFYETSARSVRTGRVMIGNNMSNGGDYTEIVASPFMTFDLRDDTSDGTNHDYDLSVTVI